MSAPQCTWTENEYGQWETQCAEVFEFNDGTPQENRFRFCPYCGSQLVAWPFTSPPDQP